MNIFQKTATMTALCLSVAFSNAYAGGCDEPYCGGPPPAGTTNQNANSNQNGNNNVNDVDVTTGATAEGTGISDVDVNVNGGDDTFTGTQQFDGTQNFDGTNIQGDQTLTGTQTQGDQTLTGTQTQGDQTLTGTQTQGDQTLTGTQTQGDQTLTGTQTQGDMIQGDMIQGDMIQGDMKQGDQNQQTEAKSSADNSFHYNHEEKNDGYDGPANPAGTAALSASKCLGSYGGSFTLRFFGDVAGTIGAHNTRLIVPCAEVETAQRLLEMGWRLAIDPNASPENKAAADQAATMGIEALRDTLPAVDKAVSKMQAHTENPETAPKPFSFGFGSK